MNTVHSIGYVDSVPLVPYGPTWREYRRLLSGVLAARKIPDIHGILIGNTGKFVQRIQMSPEDFLAHIRTYVVLLA